MLFEVLFKLATPTIGPPPRVGPFKGEPELDPGFEFEAPFGFEFGLGFEVSPEAESGEASLPDACAPEPGACGPLGCDPPKPAPPGDPPKPPCAPNPPLPGWAPCPGVWPSTGPLFKAMSWA